MMLAWTVICKYIILPTNAQSIPDQTSGPANEALNRQKQIIFERQLQESQKQNDRYELRLKQLQADRDYGIEQAERMYSGVSHRQSQEDSQRELQLKKERIEQNYKQGVARLEMMRDHQIRQAAVAEGNMNETMEQSFWMFSLYSPPSDFALSDDDPAWTKEKWYQTLGRDIQYAYLMAYKHGKIDDQLLGSIAKLTGRNHNILRESARIDSWHFRIPSLLETQRGFDRASDMAAGGSGIPPSQRIDDGMGERIKNEYMQRNARKFDEPRPQLICRKCGVAYKLPPPGIISYSMQCSAGGQHEPQ